MSVTSPSLLLVDITNSPPRRAAGSAGSPERRGESSVLPTTEPSPKRVHEATAEIFVKSPERQSPPKRHHVAASSLEAALPIPVVSEPAAMEVVEREPVVQLDLPGAEARQEERIPVSVRRPPILRSDRFIPNRQMVFSQPGVQVYNQSRPPAPRTALESRYQAHIAETLLGCTRNPHDNPILRKAKPSSAAPEMPMIPASEVYTERPERELDLPGIVNDFYLTPIAYNQKSDQLAFILGNQVYFYYPETKEIGSLFDDDAIIPDETKPVSVEFNDKGKFVVLGKQDGSIEVWSLRTEPPVKEFELKLSSARINSVVVSDHMILAGDHQGRLFKIDPKTKAMVYFFRPHRDGICNIVVSPNGRYMATGGNDSRVIVWNAQTLEKLHEFKMNAAVKAIAFDPETETRIAVGGGHKDPRVCIYRFLHPKQEEMVEIPLGSQVTNILWPKSSRMITTHKDGTYRVIPLRRGGEFPVGDILPIQTRSGRILYSGIREKNGRKMLMCGGSNEAFRTFLLPVDKSKKREPSLLDAPYQMLR